MRAPVQFPPDRRPAKPLADASCCASMQRSENKKLDYKKLSKSRKSVDFSYILVCQGWSLKSTCGFRWHHCHGRVGTERVTTNLRKGLFKTQRKKQGLNAGFKATKVFFLTYVGCSFCSYLHGVFFLFLPMWGVLFPYGYGGFFLFLPMWGVPVVFFTMWGVLLSFSSYVGFLFLF